MTPYQDPGIVVPLAQSHAAVQAALKALQEDASLTQWVENLTLALSFAKQAEQKAAELLMFRINARNNAYKVQQEALGKPIFKSHGEMES